MSDVKEIKPIDGIELYQRIKRYIDGHRKYHNEDISVPSTDVISAEEFVLEGIKNSFELSVVSMDVIEVIREEIEAEKLDIDLDIGQETIYNNAINDCLAIIDRHIGKR